MGHKLKLRFVVAVEKRVAGVAGLIFVGELDTGGSMPLDVKHAHGLAVKDALDNCSALEVLELHHVPPEIQKSVGRAIIQYGIRRQVYSEAEGAGFEPARPCGLPVFKTGAFNRSATPPRLGLGPARFAGRTERVPCLRKYSGTGAGDGAMEARPVQLPVVTARFDSAVGSLRDRHFSVLHQGNTLKDVTGRPELEDGSARTPPGAGATQGKERK